MSRRSLFAGIAACLITLQAYSQAINTAAGGRNDSGVVAAHVGFGRPNCMAIDSQGNMYVTDQVDANVRRIDAVTGIPLSSRGMARTDFRATEGLRLRHNCPRLSALRSMPPAISTSPMRGTAVSAESMRRRK